MVFRRIKRFLVGEPLTGRSLDQELLPKWKALPALSSDALSSVAYATEATLAVLIPFSIAAVAWSVPIAFGILALLLILMLSYRQTISAYPGGGGAYTVAKENLGSEAGLIAGVALLIDYVLTVAVSVAAGIENLTSALPFLTDYRVFLGTCVILLITLINLRGIRQSATALALPTYFFIFSILMLLTVGTWKVLTGRAVPVVSVDWGVYPAVPLILMLRAFGSGCAALTGVEALSNRLSLLRPPATRNAKITLMWTAGILALLFLGITALARAYGISPSESQTVLSNLGRAVFGHSVAYYLIQLTTAVILLVAANGSYSDFPRLASSLAEDRYLPRQLSSQGDRLVFSHGIVWLGVCAALLVWIFGGHTLEMIPLYAVGVFFSFTLSQAGMLAHHYRERKPGWKISFSLNSLGAITTLVVLLDIATTKFLSGTWIVILAIPVLVLFCKSIRRHYFNMARELSISKTEPWKFPSKVKHTVIIPISGVHKGVLESLRYAISISDDVRACYVDINPKITETVKLQWESWAHDIPFIVLKSPYRSVIEPLLKYIDDIRQTTKDEVITVLIPEFIATRWWHNFLHNQTAILIRAALTFKKGVVVTSVRYHLER